MSRNEFEDSLKSILLGYQSSFSNKVYTDRNNESDILMETFGITQDLKRENKQYWGRELGKCWELLVRKVFELRCNEFSPPQKFGKDEPADFFVGQDAIDTKYRVGSGDSGTLKKFKDYGRLLQNEGYNPIFLFLRTDNLPAALTACNAGGWTVYMEKETFKYIQEKTDFNLYEWLERQKEDKTFIIDRNN